MDASLLNLSYLIASVCFILALQGLSSPKHARRGIIIGALGMAIAVGATLGHPQIVKLNATPLRSECDHAASMGRVIDGGDLISIERRHDPAAAKIQFQSMPQCAVNRGRTGRQRRYRMMK